MLANPVAGGRDLDVRLYRPAPTIDTFTEPNGLALSSHVGDPGWTWAKLSGYNTLQIQGGHVIGSDATFSDGIYGISLVPNAADYSTTGDVIPLAVDTGGVFPGAQWSGVCVRMQPDGTCYALMLAGFASRTPEGAVWAIARWTGSGWAWLATTPAVVTARQPYRLTLAITGTALVGTVAGTGSGAVELTATDSAISAAGVAGLAISSPDASTGAGIDNFTCSYVTQQAPTSSNPTAITFPEASGVSQPGCATPGSITFAVPAGGYSAATLTKSSGYNSVGGETDTLSAGSGSFNYTNPFGPTVGYGFTETLPAGMLADLNAHAGGNWTVTWAVGAGYSQGALTSFTLTLTPSAEQKWQRVRLPDFELGPVDYELVEKGGFGEGHVQIVADWEDYTFSGTERVDIWSGDGQALLYRGDLRLPESHLELTETKELALYGHAAACGDWLVGRRYCYGTIVDLSQVASDLFNDIALPREASAVSDIQATGVNIQIGQELDFTKSSLAEAMDQLISLAPAQAIWGWDTAADPAGGLAPVNRFYLRPRASSAKYHYMVGDTVQALVDPLDTTQIVNQISIEGGPALQQNMANNGGFEHPCAPDEHHGSLLVDGSFEQSEGHYTHDFLGIVTGWHTTNAFWSLSGNAVLRDSVHAATDDAAQDGGWFALLGPDTGGGVGTVQQTIPIDHTKILRAAAWIRRAVVGADASVNLYLDALDAGGTVLQTIGHPSNPVNPHSLSTYLSDPIYQRVVWDCDFTGQASCTQVRFRAVGAASGSNILIDSCGVWHRDEVVQQAWLQTQSGPNSEPAGPSSPPAQVDWVWKGSNPAPIQGGYCVKVVAAGAYAPPSGGWVELQQEVYAKAKGKRFTTYTVLAQFATDLTDATVTCGCYAYASDGTLWAVLEGDQFIGGSDGHWHSLYCTIQVQDADVDLQPFLRVYSSDTVYFDSVMLVTGGPPAEALEPPAGDQNWWEGANYQWTVRCDNSSLGLTGDAANSYSTYGLRSKAVDQPLVVDRISGVAYAAGYFQTNAIPRTQVRLTAANSLTDATGNTPGLDGQVKIHGLGGEAAGGPPDDQPLTPVRIRWQYRADGVTCDIDLNNERSTMALLFLEERQSQNSSAAALRAIQTSSGGGGGNSGSGPYNNPGASSASGMASLANVAHLSGDPQRISAPTIFQPTSDALVLGVQREASGQTSPLIGVYDETGAELGAWQPDGSILTPAVKATGLTGATAASRYCGATASGAPASGTFAVGDYVVDQTGTIWICTVAGTPGTWSSPGGAPSGPAGGDLSGSYPNPVLNVDGKASKTTPVDADELPLADSASSFSLKKLTWANLKATLKSYFDTLYAAVGSVVTSINTRSGAVVLTGTDIPAFGASGPSHAQGAVPDPGSSAGTTHYLREDGTWAVPAGGGGGVTSVGLTMPSDFSVSGSPVTSSGTLAVTAANQSANRVKAGPASGAAAAPTYRALVAADLPVMGASGASHAAGAVPDPGSTAGTTHYLREDGAWAVPSSGSAGALVLLESHTANNTSGSIIFNGALTTALSAGTYDDYMVEIVNVLPASSQILQLQFSTDGGTTWDATSGHYGWGSFGWAYSGGGYAGALSTTSIGFHNAINATDANNSGTSFHGRLTVSGVGNAAKLHGIANHEFDSGYTEGFILTGTYLVTATAINALKFFVASGNLKSGSIRIYGITPGASSGNPSQTLSPTLTHSIEEPGQAKSLSPTITPTVTVP